MLSFRSRFCPNRANYRRMSRLWKERACRAGRNSRLSFTSSVAQRNCETSLISCLCPQPRHSLYEYPICKVQRHHKHLRAPLLCLPEILVSLLSWFIQHLLNEKLFSFPFLLPLRNDARLFSSQFHCRWLVERDEISSRHYMQPQVLLW